MASATGRPSVPLTMHVSGADNVWSLQWAVPHTVSSWQIHVVGRTSATGEPHRPPLGLTEVSQVEAVSNAINGADVGNDGSLSGPNF